MKAEQVKRIQKVFIIYDEAKKPCSVAPTQATAKSYVNWFLDKKRKYYIEPFLVDTNKISKQDIDNILKEFSS